MSHARTTEGIQSTHTSSTNESGEIAGTEENDLSMERSIDTAVLRTTVQTDERERERERGSKFIKSLITVYSRLCLVNKLGFT